MAENHVRAVQLHSSIKDDTTRHILEVIALDIGFNNEPATTSERKIAKRSRCAINTVRTHIDKAIESGELIRHPKNPYYSYSINPELIPYGRTSKRENYGKASEKRFVTIEDLELFGEKLYQKVYQSNEKLYQKVYQESVSSVSVNSTKICSKIYEEVYEDIPPTPLIELSTHFQSQTGCMPNPSTESDWNAVLEFWLNGGSVESAKSKITRAVEFARGDNPDGKTYTITSPRSLSNIIANLPASGQSSKVVQVSSR